MKKLVLLVITLGLVSFSSFAKTVELSTQESITLLNNISSHQSTPAEVATDLSNILTGGTTEAISRAEVLVQKCSLVGRSALVLCQTQIGVESDVTDEDSGFDSVYQLETVHIMGSMNILRVTFTPIAG